MGTDHAVSDVIGGFEPDERSRVLRCLLASHPHLRRDAESLAKEVLDDLDEDAVAGQVVSACLGSARGGGRVAGVERPTHRRAGRRTIPEAR